MASQNLVDAGCGVQAPHHLCDNPLLQIAQTEREISGNRRPEALAKNEFENRCHPFCPPTPFTFFQCAIDRLSEKRDIFDADRDAQRFHP
jgi:hypothetical protein